MDSETNMVSEESEGVGLESSCNSEYSHGCGLDMRVHYTTLFLMSHYHRNFLKLDIA